MAYRYWPTDKGPGNWNTKSFRSRTINCAVINTAYSLEQFNQHLIAPEGVPILIKSHNINNVLSIIQVAANAAECISAQSSYPLGPGEVVNYLIKDAATIWVSANIANSIVIFSVEQEP